ncbi:MAG: DUF1028 domain-containing protein [Deltaproteobacteria bacterium]|nr:MAG: DUF1028 domain-containing protein [Deltaproteobacteria bacterium]
MSLEFLASLFAGLAVPTLAIVGQGRAPAPLAHTYSIVARDPKTGELGVAVQSHYFSVGPIVPWAEAGVGAVATQSLVLVDYGPLGLDLMRRGKTAKQALDSLLAADPHNEGRQVAMVDAHGTVAAYTGKSCIPDAGDVQGEQFSCQANLMANAKVWPAMKAAYESAQGDLAERLMQALEAAEKAGGDIRGRQSAAILVVKGQASGKPWNDVEVNLRVEDHDRPLVELRRLLRLRRAYNLEDQGDAYTSEKKAAEASRSYDEAMKMAPDVVELQFWAAVTMYWNGRKPDALALFKKVFAREARWVPLVERLSRVGLFPTEPRPAAEVKAAVAEVQAQATKGAPW